MEIIIIVGHGSPEKDAGNIEDIAGTLHRLIHHNCEDNCVRVAYLQFMKPALSSAIREAVESKAEKIIIHPYFLSSGVHVTKHIPSMIKEARELFPDIEFVYTGPLGSHKKLAEVVLDRIKAVTDLSDNK